MLIALFILSSFIHKSLTFGGALNAALSGEQRRPLHLRYCAANTKAEVNQKCQALGIRLKRFVR
ncbi:hypothetical protein DNH24_20065 [Vibrio parahaemolyticus]|nr:hypothetical protein [Vibrio parahaemolyticus]